MVMIKYKVGRIETHEYEPNLTKLNGYHSGAGVISFPHDYPVQQLPTPYIPSLLLTIAYSQLGSHGMEIDNRNLLETHQETRM
jgi:hypothetical protein